MKKTSIKTEQPLLGVLILFLILGVIYDHYNKGTVAAMDISTFDAIADGCRDFSPCSERQGDRDGDVVYIQSLTCANSTGVNYYSPQHSRGLYKQPISIRSNVLRQHPTNKRYFADSSGEAIYMTGMHSWEVFVGKDSRTKYHYDDFLNEMVSRDFNFIRLWTKDPAWYYDGSYDYSELMPYKRSGSGTAKDGNSRFNLKDCNTAYTNKLRNLIESAQRKGIYVSIMLFEGWWNMASSVREGFWHGHPYNPQNNINSIDATKENVHTLEQPDIVKLQKGYIRFIIDAVNEYDNILFEISNEDYYGSEAWHLEMMDYIRQYEASKPKQHVVWVSTRAKDSSDDWLYDSTAEAISPSGAPNYSLYRYSPPIVPNNQIIFMDTDHVFLTPDEDFIFRAFTRGYNPIVMRPYNDPSAATWENNLQPILDDATQTMAYAKRMNMAGLTPSDNPSHCSTRFCLRNPGQEYFIFQPDNGPFTVNLDAGNYHYEWFNPQTNKLVEKGNRNYSGGSAPFIPPFSGQAILYLYK